MAARRAMNVGHEPRESSNQVPAPATSGDDRFVLRRLAGVLARRLGSLPGLLPRYPGEDCARLLSPAGLHTRPAAVRFSLNSCRNRAIWVHFSIFVLAAL